MHTFDTQASVRGNAVKQHPELLRFPTNRCHWKEKGREKKRKETKASFVKCVYVFVCAVCVCECEESIVKIIISAKQIREKRAWCLCC